MPAVEGRDIDALVQRTAEASLTVFATLIGIEESHDLRAGWATGSKGAVDES